MIERAVLYNGTCQLFYEDSKHLYKVHDHYERTKCKCDPNDAFRMAVPVDSQSAIVRLLEKPALSQWKVNCTYEVLREILKHRPITFEDLEMAKFAHRNKTNAAANRGTDTHAVLFRYFSVFAAGKVPQFDEKTPEGRIAKTVIEMMADHHAKILACEKMVYSRKFGVAGRFDMKLLFDGRPCICDFKTVDMSKSTGLSYYYANRLQLAFYAAAESEEAGGEYGRLIIRADKNGGGATPTWINANEFDEPAFAGLCDVRHSLTVTGEVL